MQYPFLISLPHCSSRVPGEVRSSLALSDSEIEDSEDIGSAEIFGVLPAKTVLRAEWSRLVVDLNRSAGDNGEKGVVARTDYRGRPIYRPGMYPDDAAFEELIDSYYTPYHEKLTGALADPAIRGLFDCHSLNGTGPADAPDAGRRRKDIIISNYGDINGETDPALGPTTCPVDIISGVAAVFEKAGFTVALNNPYRGGFITVHYGRKLVQEGRFALQIEMNQDLCLNPGNRELDADKIRDVRARVVAAFDEILLTGC